MTNPQKMIGGVKRWEACHIQLNLFNEEITYIRHKYVKVNFEGVYKAICKRCSFVTFIKPVQVGVWRPRTDDEYKLVQKDNEEFNHFKKYEERT